MNARPLARDLKPVARDLSAVADVTHASPPTPRACSPTSTPWSPPRSPGCPDPAIVREAHPLLDRPRPLPRQLRPDPRAHISGYSDNVIRLPGGSLYGPCPDHALARSVPQPTPRHALRQISLLSPESLSIFPTRTAPTAATATIPPLGLMDALGRRRPVDPLRAPRLPQHGNPAPGQVTSRTHPRRRAPRPRPLPDQWRRRLDLPERDPRSAGVRPLRDASALGVRRRPELSPDPGPLGAHRQVPGRSE